MTTAGAGLPRCLRPDAVYPVGAEPVAVRGGTTGLLVLHGFTGSPWEIKPLCEVALRHGWSVAAPVLPGHATSVRALDGVRWGDWLEASAGALQWLQGQCDQVHIAGFSMGALAGTLLAEQLADANLKLLLLAPAFALHRAPTLAIAAVHALGLAPTLGKADPRLPDGAKPPCYHAIPLRGAYQLTQMIHAVTMAPRNVPGPVAVVHGTQDPTVPLQAALQAAQRLFGSRIAHRPIAGSGHLLLRDKGAAQALAAAWDFLDG